MMRTTPRPAATTSADSSQASTVPGASDESPSAGSGGLGASGDGPAPGAPTA